MAVHTAGSYLDSGGNENATQLALGTMRAGRRNHNQPTLKLLESQDAVRLHSMFNWNKRIPLGTKAIRRCIGQHCESAAEVVPFVTPTNCGRRKMEMKRFRAPENWSSSLYGSTVHER